MVRKTCGRQERRPRRAQGSYGSVRHVGGTFDSGHGARRPLMAARNGIHGALCGVLCSAGQNRRGLARIQQPKPDLSFAPSQWSYGQGVK